MLQPDVSHNDAIDQFFYYKSESDHISVNYENQVKK